MSDETPTIEQQICAIEWHYGGELEEEMRAAVRSLRELEAARARIAELEDENERLRDKIEGLQEN